MLITEYRYRNTIHSVIDELAEVGYELSEERFIVRTASTAYFVAVWKFREQLLQHAVVERFASSRLH